LIKLHLYSGLFVCYYLLAFGFSSIVLNHKVDVENKEYTKTWTTEATANAGMDDLQLAESIRDELGLMGWLPRWKFRRDSVKFEFTIEHPGKKYHLAMDFSTNQVEVSEMPKGFLAVFHGLHFLNGKIPNAPFWIRSWAFYQWSALFVMTISLILGIWLWLKYSYRAWQGIAFGGLFITTLIIMMLI
jgi:hypothetical protein